MTDAREDPEFPWPKGLTEAASHEMFLAAEGSILAEFYQVGELLSTPGARRHVLRGAMRRHVLLQECRIWLRNECQKHQKPLGLHEVRTVSIYANAYYVNLCGALDNVAWMLTHELRLCEPVNEDDGKTQRFSSLRSPRFLKALGGVEPRIARRVAASQEWHKALRLLRDPAAHRLPLSIIPAILSEEEAREHSRLKAEARDSLKTGDYAKWQALDGEADRIGKFVPLLESPEPEFAQPYILPNLLIRDHAYYVDLVGAVCRMMFDRLGSGQRLFTPFVSTPKPVLEWSIGAYLSQFIGAADLS